MYKKLSRQFIGRVLIGTMLCILFLTMPLLVHAENKYQVTEAELTGTITTDSALNVRSGPGKEYEVIDKVKKDTLLQITGQTQDGWYQITLNGKTGYVSAQYVSTDTPEEAEKEGAVIGEPEEGYRGLHQSPQMKKIIAIGAVIVIVLIMIVITLMKMRREDEEYDDDEEYEDDDDDTDEEYEDDDDDTDEEYEDDDEVIQPKKASKSREYVIREEDYRIEVDPSFFEDKEYIEQPDMVTGYLERLALEEEKERKKGRELSEEKQRELDKAMKKLNELQKEIERMKNGE